MHVTPQVKKSEWSQLVTDYSRGLCNVLHVMVILLSVFFFLFCPLFASEKLLWLLLFMVSDLNTPQTTASVIKFAFNFEIQTKLFQFIGDNACFYIYLHVILSFNLY